MTRVSKRDTQETILSVFTPLSAVLTPLAPQNALLVITAEQKRQFPTKPKLKTTK